MTQLKRHESPRTGKQRNTKGKTAAARLRQLAKRNKLISGKLKGDRTITKAEDSASE